MKTPVTPPALIDQGDIFVVIWKNESPGPRLTRFFRWRWRAERFLARLKREYDRGRTS